CRPPTRPAHHHGRLVQRDSLVLGLQATLEEGAQTVAHPLPRGFGAVHDPSQAFEYPGFHKLECRLEQSSLTTEVVVQRPLGDSCPADNRIERGFTVTVLGEQLHGTVYECGSG